MIGTFALAWALTTQAQAAPGSQPTEAMLRSQAIEAFAETLMAARVEDRARLLADNPSFVNAALRYFVAKHANRSAAQHQYRAALELYGIALEIARAALDRPGESDTLQSIANTHYFLREFDEAEQAYRERLALAREMNDRDGTASSIVGLATVAYSRADYTPALASYREALAMYEAIGSAAAIGSTVISIGNVQYLQADYDAAADDYRRAIDLLTTAMDVNGVALARSGLGRVFAAQGNLASALDAYGEVLSDARARNLRGNIASALESVGEVHYRLRNLDAARAAFQEARGLAETDGDTATAGRLLGNIGLTELLAGQFDAAFAAYSESRARFERASQPEDVARAWVGIGFSQAARERFSEAMAAYRTAIDTFDRAGRAEESARAWLGLSLAQSSAGDAPSALDSALRVRRLAEKARREDLRWRAAVREGESLDALSRLDEAERAFREAIVAIEKLAPDAPLSADVRAELDESDSAWAGLAFTLAARGDASRALAAEEQRRAHIRRLAIAGAERDIFRGMSPEERQTEQQAAHDLISLRALVRAARAMPRPDPARLARLDGELASLTAKRREWQEATYARLPALRLWRGLDPAPRAEDVRPLLPDTHAVALEYVASQARLLILAVSRSDAGIDVTSTIVPFNRRAFAASLAKALEPAALRDAHEWTVRSAPLTTALLAPVAARLVDRDRVVLLPDELLWKVPFEALMIRDSDLASLASVTYATSFGTWLQQAALSPADGGTLAVIANPQLSPARRARLALTLPGWTPPDAASALDQVTALAEMYESRARAASGADATEAAVRSAIDGAHIIHLAAPLHVTGASPLFSAVVLAGDGPAPESDGRWEVREWFASAGHAQLMVLTDGGSFGAAGAGGVMDTLAWAAAAAGVPSLVLARWPADGFQQADVLIEMHDWLAHVEHLTPIEAWDAAIAISRATQHAPSAWAGLRFIGAW